jgi:alpha-N-arabinofuranosidase
VRRPVTATVASSLATLMATVGLVAAAAQHGAGAMQPRPGLATPEIIVARGNLGTVSKYLFGANLLWAYNAEGAFNPVAPSSVAGGPGRAGGGAATAQPGEGGAGQAGNTGEWYPGFVKMLRRLGVTALRYPAGTTSDSFHWMRAIGPQDQRLPNEPYGMQAATLSSVCCLLDGPAPSTVGPDEFGDLLDQIGAVGNVVVNFATGTVQEAAHFVAYMTAPLPRGRPSRGARANGPSHGTTSRGARANGPSHGTTSRGPSPDSPSYWAALRARYGHPLPYDVPYWEVGNEQYFPGQFGWRSGAPVALGPHKVPCPPSEVATCLYAFGGTTSFTDETVGTFADELPSASYSSGAPLQTFYVYFPPVVPGSATVYVDGRPWTQVASLAGAGPSSQVYTFHPSTGAITFGDGVHGAIPPAGALVTASYESGPHGGFVEFYRAMKAMDPKAQICETEGTDTAFLQLMGRTYPYDCIELHLYARPADTNAPLSAYEQELLAYPPREAAELAKLQSEARYYAGRNVPVVVTEYGQLVKPMPAADPQFNLTLDEGLLVAVQLMEWARHHVQLAEKYLADSAPFGQGLLTSAGLSIDSAMVAGEGRRFVAEPTGMAVALMSYLAGAELLPASTLASPLMGPGDTVHALWALAALGRPALPRGPHRLLLAVVNGDPSQGIRAQVVLGGLRHWGKVTVRVLDGPTAATYDTPAWPHLVTTKTYAAQVQAGNFTWYFPAHSLTLLAVHAGLPTSTRSRPGR